jgi:lipooligosaccharide transport system ATP-binding protein
MPKVISVDHVHKTYRKGPKAVDDVSFEIEEGSCFGFLGPNGAGKTTLMKMLFGMARRDPHPETRVSVFGHDPERDELAVKRIAGVVPQDDNLDVELPVRANLELFSRFYGLSRAEARTRIDELLEFMELTEKAKAGVRDLSGGMKRRLIIARALLNKPRLLILDEPTTGLDPQVRQLIWDKIRGLKRDGVTVLLTTHYMEEAYQIADRIVIMDKGKRMLEGAPRELMEREMERYVLELHGAGKSAPIELGDLRAEETEERRFVYGDDIARLEAFTKGMEPGCFFLRPTNLEDLFLRATGRHLNDAQ